MSSDTTSCSLGKATSAPQTFAEYRTGGPFALKISASAELRDRQHLGPGCESAGLCGHGEVLSAWYVDGFAGVHHHRDHQRADFGFVHRWRRWRGGRGGSDVRHGMAAVRPSGPKVRRDGVQASPASEGACCQSAAGVSSVAAGAAVARDCTRGGPDCRPGPRGPHRGPSARPGRSQAATVAVCRSRGRRPTKRCAR